MGSEAHPSESGVNESRGGRMITLSEGTVIGIPCTVSPGPFSGEHLINVETCDGPVSGFVKDADLKQIKGEWHVRAIVLEVANEHSEVRIRGSFFTTNGLATIKREMAYAA